MDQVLHYPEAFVKETLHMPSICLVLHFEPQFNDKNAIASRLRTMLSKAETRLLQEYSTHKAMPVLSRIRELIAGINYHHYKKSVALLASATAAQIFYLDFPVVETIRTGECLDVREVVKAKSKGIAYLVLVLGKHCARMYKGNSTGLTCIKYNQEAADPASGYGNTFLHKMDQGLGYVLEAYQLPVFVLGEAPLLAQFKTLTTHATHIVGYLPGHFDPLTETDILMALQPELHHWNKNKRQLLLQQLHQAREEGRLSCGVKEVWNAATHRRGRLLVVEDHFTAGEPGQEKDALYGFMRTTDDPWYMKDLVDDIIEKVLKDGGDVEFVEPGALSSFQQIALIENHHA